MLVVYNVVYISPILCLLTVRLAFRRQSDSLFERLRAFLDNWTERIVVWLFAALGILLIGDGIMWFFGNSILRS